MLNHPATGATMTYDLAGNLKNDGTWAYTHDATGQQTEGRTGGVLSLTQSYNGDRLRVKKVEQAVTTYYVRSSVLGGQVVAELNEQGQMKRGYVYLGGQMLAIQENHEVTWVHADPVTKSQRFTNSAGVMRSQKIDLDPWGVETNRSVSPQMQPHRFTTYERDANGSDEAMHRRYTSGRNRFDQPDPWDGSYDLSDPQSLNRYSYVENDPVNFVDPSGLEDVEVPPCPDGNPCPIDFSGVTVTTSFNDSVTTSLLYFLVWVDHLSSGGGMSEIGDGPGWGGGGGNNWHYCAESYTASSSTGTKVK